MKNVSFKDVELYGGFLHDKQILNETATMDAVYNRFFETGRFDAFKCDWVEGMDKKPHIFWDSDVAKWIEGAAYIIQKKSAPELEEKVEAVIDQIEKNQWEDGYFNSYYTVCPEEKRFQDRSAHELYCAGHLMEAAVAYYEATGKDRFLKLMEKYADCIERIFIKEKSAAFVTPGHEEIELALVRMYRATGNKKYLDMAVFFINSRGVQPEAAIGETRNLKYCQSHIPVRMQDSAEGHCVRACYLYSAMADVAFETDDKELFKACKKIFEDIISSKMYVTGGLGSTRIGEAFTQSYDLKNDKAYAETCASISLMYFAHRMMRFENDAVYADIIERELYNGIISGLSLDGKSFFYENPLEINLKNYTRFSSGTDKEEYAITKRKSVFDCSCCPPNLNRVLASLGDYMYALEDDCVYINQFADSKMHTGDITVRQKTEYPKSGQIEIEQTGAKKICIRIPGWCDSFEISSAHTLKNGYAEIENPPSKISINFEIAPVVIQSNPLVEENNGKVAVCCGPFVCCCEGIDNTENLHSLFLDKKADIHMEYSDELCGYILEAKGYIRKACNALYSKYEEDFDDFKIKMIPFASFANREESNMCVWMNIR